MEALSFWRGLGGLAYTFTSLPKITTRAVHLRRLLPGPYGRLLEVGCGVGHNLDDLRHSAAYLYGIDPCESALVRHDPPGDEVLGLLGDDRRHIEFLNYEFHRVVAVGEALPFVADAFEAVLASGVLCHLSPEQFLTAVAELFRVGKTVLIIDYYAERETPMSFRGTHLLWARDFEAAVGEPPDEAGDLDEFDPTRPMCFGLWRKCDGS